ncbi:hypothetical protein BCIN_15g00690 [Botrytis cinerea B05.10]|uniref:Uncharacterized protein n=1 Tax=Botryotinia fuckeliana (strain B05.10) TaxID=332648 RepID=A0A384K3U5_BOTFB|nr:hypothetical protein BCIN_15g00690 [Botrytis cinerea B05.10]ATZ57493.1 hypothetical protein BCIN_15g00690 [Botrytis cinerea B05.10]
MSRGVVLDHHAYDHGNPRNQSPFRGEDQPHQGSGPAYTDPYDPIPDIRSQTPYASSSTSSSQLTTPAHQPQPEYTGKHVGTTQYTNFGATHSLSISPHTFDATRIPPPSAKMISHYHFLFHHNNERDTVYSLNSNLKPDYHYPKTITFTRIDEPSARTSARYNQASDGRTKDDERRKIETRKAAINGGSRLVGNIYGIEERERRYQKSKSRSE